MYLGSTKGVVSKVFIVWFFAACLWHKKGLQELNHFKDLPIIKKVGGVLEIARIGLALAIPERILIVLNF